MNDLKWVKEKYIRVLAPELPDMGAAQFKAYVMCTATLDRDQVPSLSSSNSFMHFVTAFYVSYAWYFSVDISPFSITVWFIVWRCQYLDHIERFYFKGFCWWCTALRIAEFLYFIHYLTFWTTQDFGNWMYFHPQVKGFEGPQISSF
jgi:hypothetical protein